MTSASEYTPFDIRWESHGLPGFHRNRTVLGMPSLFHHLYSWLAEFRRLVIGMFFHKLCCFFCFYDGIDSDTTFEIIAGVWVQNQWAWFEEFSRLFHHQSCTLRLPVHHRVFQNPIELWLVMGTRYDPPSGVDGADAPSKYQMSTVIRD